MCCALQGGGERQSLAMCRYLLCYDPAALEVAAERGAAECLDALARTLQTQQREIARLSTAQPSGSPLAALAL